MRSGSIRATALSVVAALALLGLMAAAANAVTLTFRNDISPLQTHWKGANAVYMGFGEMPEAIAKGMNSTLSGIEYQRAQDSGIKIARTWYGQDWAYSRWPDVSGGPSWSSTKMTAFKSWLSAMKTRNIDVGLNMGWTFPWDICNATSTTCTPTTTQESNFAHWVSDSLQQLINVDGYTNIKYIFLFTESNSNFGGIPSGYGTYPANDKAYYVHIADMIDNQIRADDASRTPDVRPQVKIVGPDESVQTGEATGDNVFTQYVHDNASSDTFDVWSTHKYCLGSPGGSGCPTFDQWNTTFSSFVTEMTGKPLWADELGAGSTDEATYRRGTNYGTYLGTATAGLATAGVNASFLWQLQDQWFADPIANLYQHWGLARWLGESTDVYPAYYSYAMMGNLLGGREVSPTGGSTWVYQTDGGTTNLHALSVGISAGVSPCTLGAGCASEMVVNESAAPQSVSVAFGTPGTTGQTWYRYVYNGGNPPRETPDKSAYMPHWDKSFAGITGGAGHTIDDLVPANSVVIYSTMDLGGPTATNLAATATTTASSTQGGYSATHVNDGDKSESTSGSESWEPLSTSSGSQYVELDWATAQTFDHVDVDLTFANVAPTYTLQYWNGSAWTNFSPAVNVANNDTVRRTHTFTAVSSSKLRLTVPGPTSPPINEISVYDDPGTPDTALGFIATTDNTDTTNNKYDYEKISTAGRTFQAGDTIEYDVKLVDKLAAIGGIDVTIGGSTCAGGNALRNATGWADQNGIGGHPVNDISSRAYATWYHRVLAVPSCAVGQTSTGWMLASEQDGQECLRVTGNVTPTCAAGSPNLVGVKATAFYDNIVVKDRTGAVVTTVYANGGQPTVENYLGQTHMAGKDVFVTTQSPS